MYELKAKQLQVNLFQELKGWANRNNVNQNLIVYGEWYKGDDRLPKGFWFWSSTIFFLTDYASVSLTWLTLWNPWSD